MKVSNGIYKQVKINWGSVTLPLKEGSPVSLAGVVANNGNAIGLVPQTYDAEPLMKTIYVLAGGDVDLTEVNALSGLTLSSAAKANMSGIRFWKSDGTVDDSADASLPSVTTDDNGDVLTVVEGAWAKATPTKELPSVTADDDGDVLTVVEGAWAKATPSSGGGLLAETEYATDVGEYHDNGFKTIMDADDILDAFKAGSNVVFHFAGLPDSGGYVTEGYINLSGHYPNSGSYTFYFASSPNWLGNVSIEDEKIFFAIYSD